MISFRSSFWMDSAAVLSAVRDAGMGSLMEAGLLVEREAKQSMKGGGTWGSKQVTVELKSGKRVRRPRKARVFLPSEAGEPPHVRTGVLRSSIATAPTRRFTVVVGPQSPPAHYGQYLEFGTRSGRLKKRPFMRPALMRARTRFASLWKNLLLGRTKAGRKLNRRRGPPQRDPLTGRFM